MGVEWEVVLSEIKEKKREERVRENRETVTWSF